MSLSSLRLPKISAPTHRLARTRLRAVVDEHMRLGPLTLPRTGLMLGPVSSRTVDSSAVKVTIRSLPGVPSRKQLQWAKQRRRGEIGLVKGRKGDSAFMMLASREILGKSTSKHWLGPAVDWSEELEHTK